MTFVVEGERGRTDHVVRQKILEAAKRLFSEIGYLKSTVSDIARATGWSKAYVYKFFESKQAIGQALAAQMLSTYLDRARSAASTVQSPTEKMRLLLGEMVATSTELCLDGSKLYEAAFDSMRDRWAPSLAYLAGLERAAAEIITEGRDIGEFESTTPVEEAARAIVAAMEVYFNPILLRHRLGELPNGANEVIDLILRSLKT